MAAGAAPGGQETPKLTEPTAAETTAPAPPTNADQTYNEQIGKSEHQLNTTLIGDSEQFSTAEGNYNYQRALLGKEEPERYAANRYRGVREGISESGIQAGRTSGLAGNFLLRNARNLEGFNRRATFLNRRNQEALAQFGFGAGQGGARLNARELARLIQAGPQTPEAPPAAPTVPAQAAAVAAGTSAGPGGVVPYTQQSPGGFVRVGPGTGIVSRTTQLPGGFVRVKAPPPNVLTPAQARRAAAAKARKR